MSGPPPPPDVPPPPGKWLCPKCKQKMNSVGLGCPAACAEKFTWRHRACDACVWAAITGAIDATNNGPNPAPPAELLCLFPECKTPWLYQDMIKCKHHDIATRLETVCLQCALRSMSDVQFCPACATAGVLPKANCRDVLCGLAACGMVWCAECRKAKHTGSCSAPITDPISNDPDTFFVSDLKHLQMYTGSKYEYITRKDYPILGDTGVVFTLDGVLDSSECFNIINAAEKHKFQSLEKLFPNDYRSNDRILMRNWELARVLFDRIVKFFRSSDLRLTPMGPSGQGMWLPCGMNEVIKLARYRPTCVFKPHRDGPWAPSMDEMSLFTMVVYLNADENNPYPMRQQPKSFKGGATRFFSDDAYLQAKGEPILSITPRTGMALLFSQHLPHEGAAILSGVKYILRTEVLFRRVKSVLDPTPAFLAASEDLKKISAAYEASCKAMGTDNEKFLAEYLKAIELQAKPKPQSQKLPFADDVALAILLYLHDKEVLDKFGRLNKTCYRLSRDNSLWRTRLKMKFPEIAATGAQDLSVNWLARYKSEVESRKAKYCPIVAVDFGSGLIKCAASRQLQGTLLNSLPSWKLALLKKEGKPATVDQSKLRDIAVTTCASWYETREEVWYSHGSRSVTEALDPVPFDKNLMMRDQRIAPSKGACALTPDGFPTVQGLRFLSECPALGELGVQRYGGDRFSFVFAVPDDWTDRYVRDITFYDFFVRNHYLPRFVQASLAVAKGAGVASAVVLNMGFSKHTVSVVKDLAVVRTAELKGVMPTSAIATRIAEVVHSMLIDPGKAAARPEVTEADKKANEILRGLSAQPSDVAKRFAEETSATVAKLHSADIFDAANARSAVNYQLIMTGGRCSPKYWEKFRGEIVSALKILSAQWKVATGPNPLEDTVRGTLLCSYESYPVFCYGGALPLTANPPIDVSK